MNLDEYAEQQSRIRRGIPCWLCDHPDLREQVVQFIGDGGMKSVAADWLREHQGLEKGVEAARHHVMRCVGKHDDFHKDDSDK